MFRGASFPVGSFLATLLILSAIGIGTIIGVAGWGIWYIIQHIQWV